MNAFLSCRGDLGAKTTAYLYEAITDPDFALSGSQDHCAFQKAFGTSKTAWDFLEEPSEAARQSRFSIAMEGTARLEPSGIVVKGGI